MALQQLERQSIVEPHACHSCVIAGLIMLQEQPAYGPLAAHLACCLCCSMNAPIMVEVNDETDPLEVRYDALETDCTNHEQCWQHLGILLCNPSPASILDLLFSIVSPQIAMKELREGKIPFTVRRYLPDGSYEDWDVKDLL